jgi:hypothetical protein
LPRNGTSAGERRYLCLHSDHLCQCADRVIDMCDRHRLGSILVGLIREDRFGCCFTLLEAFAVTPVTGMTDEAAAPRQRARRSALGVASGRMSRPRSPDRDPGKNLGSMQVVQSGPRALQRETTKRTTGSTVCLLAEINRLLTQLCGCVRAVAPMVGLTRGDFLT